MTIARAEPENAAELTAIAFAAKRHWGYPERWLERWRDVLTITTDFIAQHAVWMAMEGNVRLAFGTLRMTDGGVAVIDHLWVRPAAMRRGTGRALFAQLEAEARRRGARVLAIESDPNAEGFYLKMGARTMARIPAALDGQKRFLPVMEKELI